MGSPRTRSSTMAPCHHHGQELEAHVPEPTTGPAPTARQPAIPRSRQRMPRTADRTVQCRCPRTRSASRQRASPRPASRQPASRQRASRRPTRRRTRSRKTAAARPPRMIASRVSRHRHPRLLHPRPRLPHRPLPRRPLARALPRPALRGQRATRAALTPAQAPTRGPAPGTRTGLTRPPRARHRHPATRHRRGRPAGTRR